MVDIPGLHQPDSNPSSSGSTAHAAIRLGPLALEPSTTVLDRNLLALEQRTPAVARRIATMAEPAGLTLRLAPDGGVTGELRAGDASRQLCSRHTPLEEARRLADTVDLARTGVTVARGLGLGHHVLELLGRLRGTGGVLVFEPDAGLVRAVLSRVDLSLPLRSGQLTLVLDASDKGALATALHGLEGFLASGTRIVDHPPSRARLAGQGDVFGAVFAQAVEAVRTSVVTTLVQGLTTVRNLLGNAHRAAVGAGLDDLHNLCAGRPAVLVAAGPSLARTIDALRDPHVRERVVIIAVQTVLKTLLAQGIKPHFVCALDYHAISTRFYEGLRAADVEGVTLVVEPKVHPSVLEAFPGAVRFVGDAILERLLGEGLATGHAQLKPGATVAHLAYALARWLGCDPVILTGQDLGFTDGLYYAPGAAIHQVWSGELSEFCTLEVLEWQRLMRMRSMLRKVEASTGGTIYTDQQMNAYLLQFEREFAHDAARGLLTIDATQGGVRKQHTTISTLRDALRTHTPATPLPAALLRAPAGTPRGKAQAQDRLRTLRREVGVVEAACERAHSVLQQALDVQHDQRALAPLIDRVHEAGEEARAQGAYWLVHHVSQAATLHRFKADRALEMDANLDPLTRQRRQIERDITNLATLRDGARTLLDVLDEALTNLREANGAFVDRRPLQRALGARTNEDSAPHTHAKGPTGAWALLVVDSRERSHAHDAGGATALARTVARLAQCDTLEGVLLLTDDPAHARALLGDLAHARRLRIERADLHAQRLRATCARAARWWGRHTWRAGIANLAASDEFACPRTILGPAVAAGARSVLPVHPSWTHVDPALIDALVRRHHEQPDHNRCVFTQAPAGLCPMLLDVRLLRDLASGNGPLATIGAIVGYHPATARPDPIAKEQCVPVPASVRDLTLRCSWDDAAFRAAVDRLGAGAWSMDAASLASACASVLTTDTAWPASDLRVRLTDVHERDLPAMLATLGELARAAHAQRVDPPALTIDARGQPDEHRGERRSEATRASDLSWAVLADGARRAGIRGVHVRLDHEHLERDGASPLLEALDLRIDALSVDLPADSAEAWRLVRGRDTREACWDALQTALDQRARTTQESLAPAGLLPRTWIVPRMQRREETLADVETFCDRWLLCAFACVIDPRDGAHAGARVTPLPLPASAREHRARTTRELREILHTSTGAPLPRGATA